MKKQPCGHCELHPKCLCEARLDRLGFTAAARMGVAIPEIQGFCIEADFRPRRQGSFLAYDRVRRYRSRTSSARIVMQYRPRVPWVKPWKVTMIADDRLGLTPEEVDNATAGFLGLGVFLFELAIDFHIEAGVDEKFVKTYGRFGKSRLHRGRADQLRFGTRASPKLVRFYAKGSIDSFRVEIEAHRTLIRKYSVASVRDLGGLAVRLAPKHICFAEIDWPRLRKHLVKRFGAMKGTGLYTRAYSYGQSSVRSVTRFLAAKGVANPHRFLRPLAINREVHATLRRWAQRWDNYMQLDNG
jgi:hypothetical protein